jgi:ribonuclease HI
MKYLVCLHFPASNNVAEYEALINELRITIELGIRWLDIRGDSQLIIDQVMKESNCHNPEMAMYCQEVCKLEDKFNGLELNHIPRWLNKAADERAKMTFGQELVLVGIFASDQHKPLIRYDESWQASNKPLASSSGATRLRLLLTPLTRARGLGPKTCCLSQAQGLDPIGSNQPRGHGDR